MDKDYIINHFKAGIKEPINIKIGVEHEKFLFYKKNNKRINYSTIKEIFKILYEFGWKPSHEGENVIALNKDNKSITLEPGNQIELAGAQLNNIHEACAESHDYLFELQQVTKKLDWLLKNEIIDFAGSDIHSVNHIEQFNNKIKTNKIDSIKRVLENNLIYFNF